MTAYRCHRLTRVQSALVKLPVSKRLFDGALATRRLCTLPDLRGVTVEAQRDQGRRPCHFIVRSAHQSQPSLSSPRHARIRRPDRATDDVGDRARVLREMTAERLRVDRVDVHVSVDRRAATITADVVTHRLRDVGRQNHLLRMQTRQHAIAANVRHTSRGRHDVAAPRGRAKERQQRRYVPAETACNTGGFLWRAPLRLAKLPLLPIAPKCRRSRRRRSRRRYRLTSAQRSRSVEAITRADGRRLMPTAAAKACQAASLKCRRGRLQYRLGTRRTRHRCQAAYPADYLRDRRADPSSFAEMRPTQKSVSTTCVWINLTARERSADGRRDAALQNATPGRLRERRRRRTPPSRIPKTPPVIYVCTGLSTSARYAARLRLLDLLLRDLLRRARSCPCACFCSSSARSF